MWVNGTKGTAPRTKRPSGRLQRAGTAAGSAQSLYRPEQDFREEELPLSDTAGSQRDTLPTKTPPPGSIKSSPHREAAPSLLSVR